MRLSSDYSFLSVLTGQSPLTYHSRLSPEGGGDGGGDDDVFVGWVAGGMVTTGTGGGEPPPSVGLD